VHACQNSLTLFCCSCSLADVRGLRTLSYHPAGGRLKGITVSIELLGWISSAVLLLTLMRQVYTQWKTRTTAGVSKWLFIGQLTASVGYTIYSFLLHNWVFLSSNIAILATALVGEALYLRNRRLQEGRAGHEGETSAARA
jgi:MtN3 and saliva related transmembrane protein